MARRWAKAHLAGAEVGLAGAEAELAGAEAELGGAQARLAGATESLAGGVGAPCGSMEEGWNLINALGKGRLAVLPNGPRDMETLLKLDAWENQWFPISQAALDRRFPAVSARFFLNLKQTEGPGGAITVRTFVDRYDELAGGAQKFGAEAPQALALLAQRGVTEAVVTEANDLLLIRLCVALSAPSSFCLYPRGARSGRS